jgi:hypothetical protein
VTEQTDLDTGTVAVHRVLTALTERGHAYRFNDGRYRTHCPAHDDRKQSLWITVENKRVLLHCYSGCFLHVILGALGLTTIDLVDRNDAT